MRFDSMTFLSSVLLLSAASAPALADSGAGCAPAGAQPPHLSVRRLGGAPTLRLENAPPLGRVLMLAEDPVQPRTGSSRAGFQGCLSQACGRLAWTAQLDAQGVYEIPLSAAVRNARPTLSAVVIAPGATYASASLSNAVRLGPIDDRGAQGTGNATPEVVITEIMKDPAQVSDAAGEWIELYNPGPLAVDIEGWVLSDLGSDSVALSNGGAGMPVPAGGFAVLSKNGDVATNGGVVVDYVLASTTLSNGDDEVILSLPNGQIVDQVMYDDASWPDEAGRSISLRPSSFDAVSNDDGAAWCASTTPLVVGGSDTGTPGSTNDPCTGS